MVYQEACCVLDPNSHMCGSKLCVKYDNRNSQRHER